MRAGKIYLMSEEGLIPLMESAYAAEELLQKLLADYPDLLAGDQMRPEEPRRWLLITREAAIPGEEGGLGRWSVDHLFLDQDGTPTLVEVKRSSDTRLRREVIGQMLEYAANVASYWSPSTIRGLFEERCHREGLDPEVELRRFLELAGDVGDGDPMTVQAFDEFWQRSSDSLASRRLRLVFVADVIPPELQRIIEFLNETMTRVEVLAVEVKQFVGAGRQTLVPRVIGHTAAADDVKRTATTGRPPRRDWTLQQFLASTEEVGGPSALAWVQQSLDWAKGNGLPVTLGHGKYGPLYLMADAEQHLGVSINALGTTQVLFTQLVGIAPFDQAAARMDWCRRLNDVAGVEIDEAKALRASWADIPLRALDSVASRAALLDVVAWVAERIRQASINSVPGSGDLPAGSPTA